MPWKIQISWALKHHPLIKLTWADLPSPALANLGCDKKAGSLLYPLPSLIHVSKDHQKHAHAARKGETSPTDGQSWGRWWDSTKTFHLCPVNVVQWHQIKLGEEKTWKYTWLRGTAGGRLLSSSGAEHQDMAACAILCICFISWRSGQAGK